LELSRRACLVAAGASLAKTAVMTAQRNSDLGNNPLISEQLIDTGTFYKPKLDNA